MSFSGIMDTLAPILKFSSTWFLCISPNGTPQEFWDIWDKRLPLPVNWTREESPGDIQKCMKHVEAMRPYDSDFLEFLHDGVSQWFSVYLRGDTIMVAFLEDTWSPQNNYAPALAALLDHIHTAFLRFTVIPIAFKACIEDSGPWTWKGDQVVESPSIRVQEKRVRRILKYLDEIKKRVSMAIFKFPRTTWKKDSSDSFLITFNGKHKMKTMQEFLPLLQEIFETDFVMPMYVKLSIVYKVGRGEQMVE